ncbi:MAG: GNAT family N-acetyltransferase [Methylomicrobium sp.]|nr:GNAT family N-acetyltransferase [Methylomicrobium sp.]
MTWKLLPINEFDRHIKSWDRLNQSNTNTPLLSSDFVQPLLRYFSTPQDHLAIYGDPSDPQAMAIITKPKFGVWETKQPSQAPIGLWLQDNNQSVALLMKNMLKTLPFPSLLFGITQQDPDLLPRPIDQGKLNTLDYIQTARVTVSDTFENYWSQRGKNLRQNLRRQRNRLERDGITTKLNIITEPEKITQAIIDYGTLESAGWKSAGGTAIHIDNDQGKFYRNMLTNFCRHQDGLIFQYYYDNQLVATDLCIKNDDSLIILKTTYDEAITTSSPAMLMRQEAFEYIFNNRLANKIEFYGKVMDWHTKWSDHIRKMYHVNYSLLKFHK